MRVDLNAKVRTHDGKDAGTVEQVILDPNTNEVTDFVISTGALLGRDILLPREVLERASRDGETVVLDITKDELDEMPNYVSSNYSNPPSGWLMPTAYGYPSTSYLWPAGYDYDALPNVRPDLPEGIDLTQINKGGVVMDKDGDDIGVVEDVIFDQESGDLMGFVLKIGNAFQTLFGMGETVEISRELVDRISDRSIYLRGDKEEIKRLAKARK